MSKNERRTKLIDKKWEGEGLTQDEAAELAALQAELEADTEHLEPTPPEWLTTLAEQAAEITRLRTELAEAQAAREQTVKNWEADIRAMNALRDTLRQQLAVARDGLGRIAQSRPAMLSAQKMQDHARDTLAKLEKVGPTESA